MSVTPSLHRFSVKPIVPSNSAIEPKVVAVVPLNASSRTQHPARYRLGKTQISANRTTANLPLKEFLPPTEAVGQRLIRTMASSSKAIFTRRPLVGQTQHPFRDDVGLHFIGPAVDCNRSTGEPRSRGA